MGAGKYRHRIAIQTPVTTRGTAGGLVPYWDLVEERWAAKIPIRGREFLAGRQLQAEQLTRFLLRHIIGITPKMRLITQDQAYDITSIVDVQDLHKETEILGAGDPSGAPRFQYADIAVGAGGEANEAEITWDTDAFTSTQVRYRIVGDPDWIQTSKANTPEGVLSHTVLLEALDNSSNYEAEVQSENADAWTPGWENTLTWGIDDDGTFLPGGYPP